MKLIERTKSGQEIAVVMTWSDHAGGCTKCGGVDFAKPSTFVNACAQGSPLLMEKLVELQRPAVKERAEKIKEEAKRAGVFKMSPGVSKEMLKQITKYK